MSTPSGTEEGLEPPLPEEQPTTLERIDVYYRFMVGGVYHKYVVYTDSDGNQHAAHGGPVGGIFGIFSPAASSPSTTGSGGSAHGTIGVTIGPCVAPDKDKGISGFVDHPGVGKPRHFESIRADKDLSVLCFR